MKAIGPGNCQPCSVVPAREHRIIEGGAEDGVEQPLGHPSAAAMSELDDVSSRVPAPGRTGIFVIHHREPT